MNDPHAATQAAQSAIAFTGISTIGMLLASHADTLVFGLAAAVAVTIWLDTINGIAKSASAIIFATLVAGYSPPLLAAYLGQKFTYLAGMESGLRILLAILVGGMVPHVFPHVIGLVNRKISGGQP